MTGSQTKAFVSLLVLFLCGGVSGYEVSRKVGSAKSQNPSPIIEAAAPQPVEPSPVAPEKDPLRLRYEEDLAALELSPSEAKVMRQHFEELEKQIRDIKADTRREIARKMMLYHRSVAKDLTPAQRKQYLRLQEERRQKKKNTPAPATVE